LRFAGTCIRKRRVDLDPKHRDWLIELSRSTGLAETVIVEPLLKVCGGADVDHP
jgi:hypothetical protein